VIARISDKDSIANLLEFLLNCRMNNAVKSSSIFRIALIALAVFGTVYSFGQNTNLANLLNSQQWDELFPRRAGTYGVHPQGYTADFYSFENLIQAADEMSDYTVEIRLKEGVWGQLITITTVSNGTTYNYSDVDASWYSSPIPETIINVDFGDFVNRTNDQNNKRELGAFLANISKETTGGWQQPIGGGSEGDYAQWGLYFVHEVGYTIDNSAGAYSQASSEYPPNPAVGYYGRGPIQLSWNYNYGQLSKFLFNDVNILLDNPNAIQEDGVLAFKSAIWFWMMPQCPKPSCHQVMHELWEPEAGEYTSEKMYKNGFAHTNNIINGALECRSASTADFTAKVILRSELYKFYLSILGFTESEIALENSTDYSTLCYESEANAMQDYASCSYSTSISTSELEQPNVLIYPNPASEFLNIVYSPSFEKAELINSLGQIVESIQRNSTNSQLDISNIESGCYTLRIFSKEKMSKSKVVINH
jgi:hypothetical protein